MYGCCPPQNLQQNLQRLQHAPRSGTTPALAPFWCLSGIRNPSFSWCLCGNPSPSRQSGRHGVSLASPTPASAPNLPGLPLACISARTDPVAPVSQVIMVSLCHSQPWQTCRPIAPAFEPCLPGLPLACVTDSLDGPCGACLSCRHGAYLSFPTLADMRADHTRPRTMPACLGSLSLDSLAYTVTLTAPHRPWTPGAGRYAARMVLPLLASTCWRPTSHRLPQLAQHLDGSRSSRPRCQC